LASGGELEEKIAKGIDEEHAISITEQILSGLQYLHDKNIVHLDLKPENILFSGSGEAKIADFGISKSIKELLRSEKTTGTPYYMSPEQFAQTGISPRSDLYSLGLIIYEMLTRKKACVAKTYEDATNWHKNINVDVSKLDIGYAFKEFISTCTAKDSSKRFLTAQKALDFLRGNLKGQQGNSTAQLQLEQERLELDRKAQKEKERLERERLLLEKERLEIAKNQPQGQSKIGLFIIIFFVLPVMGYTAYNAFLMQEKITSATSPTQEVQRVSPTSNTSAPVEKVDHTGGKTGLELVLIPHGSFTMGCKIGRDKKCDFKPDKMSETPAHKVTITKDFYLAKYEVTQGLYQKLMGENPSKFKNCGAACPVEKIGWHDAILFLNKLSEQENLEPCYTLKEKNVVFKGLSCKGYRLPTEAEWEYAARANEDFSYAGSSDFEEISWNDYNSDEETHPVGELKPNSFGLYDMNGNVGEWVWDWFAPYNKKALKNPMGPQKGYLRISRGGYYGSNAFNLRLSRRDTAGEKSLEKRRGFWVMWGLRVCRSK
jgi:formylglycine-generating enzyme required for sulfatase activity